MLTYLFKSEKFSVDVFYILRMFLSFRENGIDGSSLIVTTDFIYNLPRLIQDIKYYTIHKNKRIVLN